MTTHTRILEAALSLFSKLGYSNVSTRSIAETAGVNEVSIFRHFGTKLKLYIAVFHEYAVHPDADAFHNDTTGDLRHDLIIFGDQFVHLYHANSRIMNMSIKTVKLEIPEISSELKKHIVVFKDALCRYFDEYSDTVVPDHRTTSGFLVDLMFGYATHLERQNRLDELSTGITRLLELFLSGGLTRS